MIRNLSLLRNVNLINNQIRLINAANTLKVKNEVNRKREAALLGGGQKRIDSQHKKGLKNSDSLRIKRSVSILMEILRFFHIQTKL